MGKNKMKRKSVMRKNEKSSQEVHGEEEAKQKKNAKKR